MIEIVWDLEIQAGKKIKHNRPGIKKSHEKKLLFIDLTTEVIAALGTISKRPRIYLKILGIQDTFGSVQISVLMGTGRSYEMYLA